MADEEKTEITASENCEGCVITYDQYAEEKNTVPAKQNRFRSWAVWVSVLGAVGVILNAFGVFEKLGIDSMAWDVIVNAIGAILIAFGILNNPTDKGAF